jgi:hypothetical protein
MHWQLSTSVVQFFFKNNKNNSNNNKYINKYIKFKKINFTFMKAGRPKK